MKTAPSAAALPPVRHVFFPAQPQPVEQTAAAELARLTGAVVTAAARPGAGVSVSLAHRGWAKNAPAGPQDAGPWMWLRLAAGGTGEIAASEPAFLFAAVSLLARGLTGGQRAKLAAGLLIRPAFRLNRPLWDNLLTQYWRTVRNFDAESYVRTLAENGFTHLEVNGLHAHMPMEEVAPTEFYAQFYTYCAGFNHFVDTPLTRGLWPAHYLEANLQNLKRLAALGRKYGLKPGLCMFEPRSLPERFFQRYPTLRGARVDHPFRSRQPRYTLAQDHPVTLRHYRELIQALMREVPDLDYLSIWANDSGAGFEHTASLYVGRNGGPYMIREWNDHEKVAKAAGESIVRYLRNLQSAAAETNPAFNVFFRIEPYKVEHDTILAGLGRQVDLEAPSLLVHGYDLPYTHPKYPHVKGVAGTVFHTTMDPVEKPKLAALRRRGLNPALTYTASSAWNHEPLVGLPFPRSVHQKLRALRATGADRVNAYGGLVDPARAPYWPNPAAIRAAQFSPDESIDGVLADLAARFAGPAHAAGLVACWDAFEEAFSYQPLVPLFTAFGFIWQRSWDRPFVPDIEAIPAEDRRYYEKFGCFQPNNPGINDFGRDVLFQLITKEHGRRLARDFDREVLPRLKKLLGRLAALIERAGGDATARAVFTDLRDRTRAYLHWCTTLRNICGWVYGVYAWLDAKTLAARRTPEAFVQSCIDLELANTRGLLELWETSTTEFMAVSGVAETGFMYGENFGGLLRKKIALTEKYRHREPRIDRDIIWRIEPGLSWPDKT